LNEKGKIFSSWGRDFNYTNILLIAVRCVRKRALTIWRRNFIFKF